MNFESTKASVNKMVDRVLFDVTEKTGINLGQVEVRFFDSGRVAGKAFYKANRVEFNVVLAHENLSTFINTVKHEIAHLVTRKIYPKATPHGKEFKYFFTMLGGNGERCHNYDVSNVIRGGTFEYKCNCKTHFLSKIRHNRANKTTIYTCNLCGSKLVKV